MGAGSPGLIAIANELKHAHNNIDKVRRNLKFACMAEYYFSINLLSIMQTGSCLWFLQHCIFSIGGYISLLNLESIKCHNTHPYTMPM
jgi:hypothetical protein